MCAGGPVREKCRIPWSYRRLWMGAGNGNHILWSGRAVHSLNCWAISPVSDLSVSVCWMTGVQNPTLQMSVNLKGYVQTYGEEWVILLSDNQPQIRASLQWNPIKISKGLWLFWDDSCSHFRMSQPQALRTLSLIPYPFYSPLGQSSQGRSFMAGLTASGPDRARSSNGIFSSRTALTFQPLEVSLSFQGRLCSCQRDGGASL